jgi:mRNA interferase HigB
MLLEILTKELFCNLKTLVEKIVLELGILISLSIVLMERIFAKSTLRLFWEKHPEAEQYLKTWYNTAMSTSWETPSEVKKTYANASILKNGNPEAEQYLKTWYNTAMSTSWETPSEVKKTYANASILKNGRIVFNIKGNSFRLIAKFNFEKQWIFIRFIGTHAAYDKIDANTI